MTDNLKSTWVFDGESLSTPYSDVQYRSSGMGIPSRDGDNLKNSSTDGTAWQPYKPFDEKRVPLALWVTGLTSNPEVTPKQALDARIDKFTLLFGRSGSLYRLERRHFMDSAVNQVTNPRFQGNLVSKPTGITKLASANYTAPANGYLGFEIPTGASIKLTLNGVEYSYLNVRKAIAGWVYLESGQTSSGTLPAGAKVFWYNPNTSNHVRVMNLFPLPKAIDQWQMVNWTGGKMLVRSDDGSGELVASTHLGGQYKYYPIPHEAIEPEEPILAFYVRNTLAPLYVTELTHHFSDNVVLDEIPTTLFEDIEFADSSYTTVNVPSGNIVLVPTERGWVLPAQGTSVTYDTYGQIPNTTQWEYFYGSGMVKFTGRPPKTTVTALGSGITFSTYDGFFYDADFRDPGQTVRVTLTNDLDYIVSPTVVSHVGVYSHVRPMNHPPDFMDGDSAHATWLGTPHSSLSLVHSTRWIDVECPTTGVDFQTQAGGTRATFDLELIAPGVYWRDNVDIHQQTTWTQTPSQSGEYHDWVLSQFGGGTGPLGGVLLDLTVNCARDGWDVEVDVHDAATKRIVTLRLPVNQTWRLDSKNFLFYQTHPHLSIDRYASMLRVSRTFGGDLLTVHPNVADGTPLLQFRTPEYASDTLNFTVKLTAHRRYLNA